MLQHDKSIPVCLTIERGGVTLFEAECNALVDYDTIDGELEYTITGFQFENYVRNGQGARHTVTAINDAFVFGLLKSAVSDDHIIDVLNQDLSHSYDPASGIPERSWVTP